MDNAAVGMALVAAELQRTSWQSLAHPGDLQKAVARATAMLSGQRETDRITKRYLRADGELRWSEVVWFFWTAPIVNL